MYEIKSSKRIVGNVEVDTWRRTITDANIIEVEAGTTGYCGGDTGHGSRTFLSIKDLSGTDIACSFIKDENGRHHEFSISLGGDSELRSFIEALKFALSVYEDAVCNQ